MKKSITESQLRSIIRQTIEEAIKPWHGADNINVLDNLSLADAGVSYDETPLEPGELSMMAQDEDPNINSIARDPMNWASLPKDYVEKTVSEAIKKTLQETPQIDWFHENDSPSPLEEEFEESFCATVEQYMQPLLSQGYHPQELADWCCEMINKIILQ